MTSSQRRASLRTHLGSAILLGCAVTAAASAGTSDAPASPSAPDHAAIAQVLETYRSAVSSGDEALFTTTLLDDDIPFFAVGDAQPQPATLQSSQTRGVAAFRSSVFHSGRRYSQRFDDIRIVQDGALAQATLRFVTLRGDGSGGEGWKTLTLVNAGGAWKIASEFYTVRAVVHDDADAR